VGVQAPFGGGGQVGLHDGEVGDAGQGAPAARGGPLLDFDWADVSFGLVVCPGHCKVNYEAQDHVFVVAEAPGQGQRVGGQRPGAGAVVGDAQLGGAAVVVADRGQLFRGPGRRVWRRGRLGRCGGRR
jgi:hypothetical protein